MNWRKLARAIGLKAIAEASRQPTVDDIKPETAIAANIGALSFRFEEEPFPDAVTGDRVVSDSFRIPDAGWGLVWGYQRQFWLEHKTSGVRSRWINGRTKPQEIKRSAAKYQEI